MKTESKAKHIFSGYWFIEAGSRLLVSTLKYGTVSRTILLEQNPGFNYFSHPSYNIGNNMIRSLDIKYITKFLDKNTSNTMWVTIRDPYEACLSGLATSYLEKVTKEEKWDDEKVMLKYFKNFNFQIATNRHFLNPYFLAVYEMLKIIPEEYLNRIILLDLDTYKKNSETEDYLTSIKVLPDMSDLQIRNRVLHSNNNIKPTLEKLFLNTESRYFNPYLFLICTHYKKIYELLRYEYRDKLFVGLNTASKTSLIKKRRK